jgi:hypothetical protein
VILLPVVLRRLLAARLRLLLIRHVGLLLLQLLQAPRPLRLPLLLLLLLVLHCAGRRISRL